MRANINAQDNGGNTVLHDAVLNKAPIDAIEYLVENGANPCILNNSNKTASSLASNMWYVSHYLEFAERLQKFLDKTGTFQALAGLGEYGIGKYIADAIRIGGLKFIVGLVNWNKEKYSMYIESIDPHVTAKPGTNLWYLQLCELAIKTESLKLFTEVVRAKPELWKYLDLVVYDKPVLNERLSKSKKIFGAIESENNKLAPTMLRLKDAWDKADEDKVKEPIINFRSKRTVVYKIKTESAESGVIPADVALNIIGFMSDK